MKPYFLFLLALLTMRVAAAEEQRQVSMPDTLNLPIALEFALENNFQILQARERIKEQEGVIIEARSSSLPQVNLNYNYSLIDRNRLEDFGGNAFGSDEDWAINLEVKQRLYHGFAARNRVKSGQYQREAALLEMKAVINTELLKVRTLFYDLLLAQKRIEVQEQSIELLKEQLKTVQDRYDSGSVSRFERLRAEVAVANAKPPFIQAKNDFRLLVEQMRETLGFTSTHEYDYAKVPQLIGDLVYEKQHFDLWTVLQAARANRPELEQLRNVESALSYEVKAQRSPYQPTLDFVTGYQIRKSSFSDDLSETVSGWIVGLEGSWAIFDGHAIQSKVLQARSRLNQAKLSTSEAMLAIDVEIRRAYSLWLEADELVNASLLVIEQAEESLNLAENRFEVGAGTQLDVLSAQVDLTEARTNQIEAYHRHNVAIATIRKAMGVDNHFVSNEVN